MKIYKHLNYRKLRLKYRQTARQFFILMIVAGLMLIGFNAYEHIENQRRIQRLFNLTTQCDIPYHNVIIEVDCFTPEAYQQLNKDFNLK